MQTWYVTYAQTPFGEYWTSDLLQGLLGIQRVYILRLQARLPFDMQHSPTFRRAGVDSVRGLPPTMLEDDSI